MPLGCATNCFPLALPARFARVVAAYSLGLRLLIAALGRYLSPVSEDFLPLLVLHDAEGREQTRRPFAQRRGYD